MNNWLANLGRIYDVYPDIRPEMRSVKRKSWLVQKIVH